MKELNIITFVINQNNYGQRLQNFALQEFLKIILKSENFDLIKVNTIKISNIFNGKSFSFYKEFEDKYLTFKEYPDVKTFYEKNKENNDVLYILGSDQIFQYYYIIDNINFYTLDFPAECFKNKICYAASMPDIDFQNYKNNQVLTQVLNNIKNINNLSFRESYTAELYNKTFNKKALMHIDPTFLLEKEKYFEIIHEPEILNLKPELKNGFDLIFIIYDNITANNIFNELKKQNPNICYVNVFYQNAPLITMNDFLWLIKNCNKIYTNSFHGVCFSIIFNKKLYFYNNNKINLGRIDNLIKLFNINKKQTTLLNCSLFEYNEEYVKQILIKEREKSFEYLKNNILKFLNEKLIQPIEICAYSKDNEQRSLSTSGGISARLAEYAFSKNGIFYGSTYTEDFKKVKQISVDNIKDYYNFISGSKYSYSIPAKFEIIKSQLEQKKFIVYSGCPCHIKALTKYLKKDYDNLLKIELLCSGTSTNKLKKFIENIENKEQSKVIKLNMRYKHSSECLYILENNKEVYLQNFNSYEYFINSYRQEMCKKCTMHLGSGYSDIILGDFWDHYNNGRVFDQNYNPLSGTNYIIIKTNQGQIAFNKIKDTINFKII